MSEGVVTKQDEIDAAYRLGQRGHHRRHEVLPRLLDPSLALQNRVIERKPNGQFAKGVSGNLGGNAHRSRHALNADTIREMHAAFRRGGREAIDKVMRTQPAAFLKLLVLLVPREMKVEHTGGVKSMSDEELERGIEAVQLMLAARDAGANAKVIEAVEESPSPGELPPGNAKL